ncbi:helix-turn-helix transcriptional regulator [Nocardia asteroides NBRC 15531]|nr:helix-turn-helix transcriptional regulator [Nocardia asteroides NBRC 15531]SFM01914.1 Transcriptional regulator, contains XRE-family HTH domain [Nocardia asteroides]VEG37438.1 Predicted transcriptional regulator [Nocardia asteroides]
MLPKSSSDGPGGPPKPPTLGGLLRRLRDDRRISREKLAFAAGVSSSYITHLESGDRDRPTQAVIEALVRYLDRIAPVSDIERRHLWDLAGLAPVDNPSVEDLRAEINDEMRRALSLQAPNLAAYVDTRWNVLAGNDAYHHAFPGLVEDVNILRWFFGNPLSRKVMVEWEKESTLTVHWLRGLIGQQGGADWAAELLDELAQYPDFRRIWDDGDTVYGREHTAMRLCDLHTGEYYTVDVQLFRLDSVAYPGRIQFYLAVRGPDGG